MPCPALGSNGPLLRHSAQRAIAPYLGARHRTRKCSSLLLRVVGLPGSGGRRPPGQWAFAPHLGARHREREDSSGQGLRPIGRDGQRAIGMEGRRPIGRSEGSPRIRAVCIGLDAGAERVGKVVSVGQVSPFASAGIGRSRAGGEDLDPVPEVVVAVESFEAIQCPAFGPVHLVP